MSAVTPASPTILLTGFEPFGDHAVNPSGEIARALHGRRLAEHAIVSLVLPVERAAVWAPIEAAIIEHRPRIVLATGVSRRPRISVESTARNLDDYPIPDNAGQRPAPGPILPDAPDQLRTPVDTRAVAEALWLANHFAEPSTDAGTYLCNHLYFRLLHHHASAAARNSAADPFTPLFVHLPPREPDDALGDLGAVVDTLVELVRPHAPALPPLDFDDGPF